MDNVVKVYPLSSTPVGVTYSQENGSINFISCISPPG